MASETSPRAGSSPRIRIIDCTANYTANRTAPELSILPVLPMLVVLVVLVMAAVMLTPQVLAQTTAGTAADEVRLPEGWSIQTDAVEGALVAGVVTDIRHSGDSSVVISHPEPASTTLVSRPVHLEVGRVYRLEASIRTEGVRSDPTSRYPTAVPACLTMASFPFTNHSPTVGGDTEWTHVETLFVATRSSDRIRLHLGLNGSAGGSAWFDDVSLEELQDIREYIPAETVTWHGPGYRYDDQGWIFVHIEGEPYERGTQYGSLVADEIVSYIEKLAYEQNADDPEAGWSDVRFMVDATLLRKYDTEYLREMKGIADGAAEAGAEIFDRPIELLDVVAINSIIDLDYMRSALRVTPNQLTGESFLSPEDELQVAPDKAKCSAMVATAPATAPATAGGGIVFGQIFMWSGYTGVHWNVICDIVPSEGHRLVYETFPGGIHSGADFYINDAGIIIGETTVSQTPYEPDGTPQSNRIRRAAQYASSIDQVVETLWQGNNGMYTNDWPIADIKTGEGAILLLGTHQHKVWRTSDQPPPFGTPGFLWANNNNRDPEVRKEYVAQPEDAPYDLIFGPWNRDLAFNEFYAEHTGSIDAIDAVNLWASSPVNRAHACDGKITTTEMAEQLVFLAHYGKLTLREKIPGESGRNLRAYPDAIPHLSLGYSVPSPIYITRELQKAHAAELEAGTALDTGTGTEPGDDEDATADIKRIEDRYQIEQDDLWHGTVYPAGEAEAWLVSGSARYWRILHDMIETRQDEGTHAAAEGMALDLAGLATRFEYTVAHEPDLEARDATRAYDRYGPSLIPRIKGTVALHQLHLLLGTEQFLDVMRALHERFREQETSTEQLIETASKLAGRDLAPFLGQWLERTGLPRLELAAEVVAADGASGDEPPWSLELTIRQPGEPYHLMTSVEVETAEGSALYPIEVSGPSTAVTLELDARPLRLRLDPLDDVPLERNEYYTWQNLVDDFHHLLFVYGTSRQNEANHTIADRWRTRVADAYIEILPPLVKDSELTPEMLRDHDLMVLGHATDSSLVARMATQTPDGPMLPVELEKNLFRWQGETYADSDDGLILVLPSPFNHDRVLYLMLANSALELYQMTEQYHRDVHSWARFKGDEIVDGGFHRPSGTSLELDSLEVDSLEVDG